MDLRVSEEVKENGVVGVAMIPAIRASVLDATQVANEGQEHLD